MDVSMAGVFRYGISDEVEFQDEKTSKMSRN
jgi:hypothetical protein